ncbi:ORF6N domain-containing protein [Algoriphagus sp. AGSA1]|uniref:ORF6N domain-containing protein n=1 Tax=Algoriphagus sp. AGSA1 TaxID=2907213 RepID=UPI001F221BB8|nr:ORF6N domain-containing protein [Algoriphagus sp. AGSA1]MCE7055752.1 ORF6N domain-containing protein [Algoriphagus sp. AGSA1]
MNSLTTEENILELILKIRNQKVMLDSDLAEMYGVPTKRLNEQVKRNSDRFPEDFMFQLKEDEWRNLKSQFATSRWGGRRTPPYVFTEQGVAMLSSVLNSAQAIQVNISIMRIFVKMRDWAMNYSDLQDKIHELQQSESDQNHHIAKIYQIIEELLKPAIGERKAIGFKK